MKRDFVGCVLRTATHPATTNEVNCEPHFGTHRNKLRGCTALRCFTRFHTSTAPSAPYTFAANLSEIHKSQSRRRWSRVQHEVHQCAQRFLDCEQ